MNEDMQRRVKTVIAAGVLIAAVVIDQLTKILAIDWLKGHPPQIYLGNLFRLEYSENPGAFLSLGSALSESTRFWVLSVAVALSLVGLLIYTVFYAPFTRTQLLGTLLLIGGGISNLIDRLFRTNGQVVDFMNMGIGSLRTGIFNVADMLIMAGVAIILLFASHQREGQGSSPSKLKA